MVVHVNDLSIFVDERGAANAEPILFIHGFPFDHSMWRYQMAQFSATYRCIAPDLRGHGGTTEIESRTDAVSVDTLADDLIALLDQTIGNTRRITICGLSMGGYTAFVLWRKIPSRIARLILADTKATSDTSEVQARRQAQADKVANDGAKAISNGMLDGLLAPAHRNGVIGMEVRRMIESTTPRGIVDTLRALANRPDSTPILATITVPTLVIVGEHDKTTPISDARYMHERLAHVAPLAVIPGAGHVTSLENPVAFNQAVTSFLSAN